MTAGAMPSAGTVAKPPKGAAWVWLPRELLMSRAWRSLGINARRLIDVLLLDHMSHGGRHNGRLKATHRQLVAAGITRRLVAGAIREAEDNGLIDCARGGQRVATCFALTWMTLHDGTPPSDRWRTAPDPAGAQKSRNLPSHRTAALPPHRKAERPNLPPHRTADGP